MSLQDIHIKVADAHSVGNVEAILNEIATRLDDFVNTSETGLIDLKSLPFSTDEYERLRAMLGRGEVTARLNSIGESEIYETHFPGVWWVTHYNVEGDIVADLIEIASVPAILQSQWEDVRTGLGRLRQTLTSVRGEPVEP
ncbi:MAG: hydrogenase expression/formation protein [Gallionella sp.]|jgi:hydrogenase-1 operon protein HyaF|nr:hydrogenase expression/formation protein [Gallionella sp.]MCK9355305.1 hydrogenase expression/formation protein [Gallionella sp.]